MDYAKLFEAVSPGFFERESIRSMPEDDVCVEQVIWLRDWESGRVPLSCPENITFGIYTGPNAPLKEAVAKVDEDWVQYFGPGRRTFCAFDGDKIVSFCNVDKMCEFEGARVAGPGCVGTVPEYRKRGIGLKMVEKATQLLKDEGYDISFIHYTHLENWYARLGYETVVRCNGRGVIWSAADTRKK
ncbi:MAG: GNAT family N-acetyltransferase [Clostridiales bacterium]|nr:GNAT family N-acetyltransferase [Clostridiales bacterium]